MPGTVILRYVETFQMQIKIAERSMMPQTKARKRKQKRRGEAREERSAKELA